MHKSGLTRISYITSIFVFLVPAFICAASPAMGEVEEEAFYRRMITTDLQTLKGKAAGLVVSNPDSAIAYLSVIAARYTPNMNIDDKKTVSMAMNNLAYLHFFHNEDPVVSYSYLVRGMNVAEEIRAKDVIANLALNMANVFCTLDEYDSAVEYFRKSIAAGLESKTFEPVLSASVNLLSLAYSAHPEMLPEILPEMERVRLIKDRNLSMSDYTMSIIDGVTAIVNNNYDEAEKYFEVSLNQIKTDLTPLRFRHLSLGLLSNLSYYKGDYQKSLKYLNLILKETDAPDIRASVYNQLSRSYKAVGDNDNSAYYLSRYVALSDTLLRSGQAKALRDIERQNSQSEFNRRIEHAEDERHTLVIIICLTLVALAGVTVLGVWLWISRRKLEKANGELYRQARAKALEATDIDSGNPDGNEEREKEDLLQKLRHIMETSPEIYQSDFSVDSLARLADTPSRKVSQTINVRTGTNFNTFLQEYRVKEACRRLDDKEHYGNHTIEAISEGLGFKSRSNFIAIFKKFTGLTPSAYHKIGASRP